MDRVLEKYCIDFNELRRVCIRCHGLDLTTSHLYTDSTYLNPSVATKAMVANMMSSALLELAILLRTHFYANSLDGTRVPGRDSASMYYMDARPMIEHEISLKTVCDKIIHARGVDKFTIPVEIREDAKICIQFSGSHQGRDWILNICLEVLAEYVLSMLDEADEA